MKIIVHSCFDSDTIQTNLGEPQYSYYFVLLAFLPVLAKFGDVVQITDPGREVDRIFAACETTGEPCVFFCFAPPHLVPIDLRCPTIPVIAWEFATLPCESWGDDPRSDWRVVFRHCVRAITLSRHTAQLVRAAMGDDYPVFAIPGASFDNFADFEPPSRLTLGERRLRVIGHVDDSSGETPPPMPAKDPPHRPEVTVTLRDVVYVSVFSPRDGRKNWRDLLTGFVYALGQSSRATLLLKIPMNLPASLRDEMAIILGHLRPFQCRIVILSGYLDDANYAALVRASTYYVNASHCEGLCLPLIEFLSAGRPAVAPDHTAMADYIADDLAFRVQSSLEHNVMPHDPRDLFTTMRYRLNWSSLVDAYQASFQMALRSPESYARMAARAREAMRNFCSGTVIEQKMAMVLADFLDQTMPVRRRELAE